MDGMTYDLQGIPCSPRKRRLCQWNVLRNEAVGSQAKEGSWEPGCGKQKLIESLGQVGASRGQRTESGVLPCHSPPFPEDCADSQ